MERSNDISKNGMDFKKMTKEKEQFANDVRILGHRVAQRTLTDIQDVGRQYIKLPPRQSTPMTFSKLCDI